MLNKKAQISLEIIIVLGILVLGALFFGISYLGQIERRTSDIGDLDGIFDDWEGFDYPGIDYPNIPPEIEDTEVWHFFTTVVGVSNPSPYYYENEYISFNLEATAGAERRESPKSATPYPNFDSNTFIENLLGYSGLSKLNKIRIQKYNFAIDNFIDISYEYPNNDCTIAEGYEIIEEHNEFGVLIDTYYAPTSDNRIYINILDELDQQKYTKHLERILKCNQGTYQITFETEFDDSKLSQKNYFKETSENPTALNYYDAWPGSNIFQNSTAYEFEVIPSAVDLSIEITQPTEPANFFETDIIQLQAVSNKPNVFCDWFISEKSIETGRNCNYILNLQDFEINPGVYDLTVYAVENTLVEGMQQKQIFDSIKITIYKNDPLFLLNPGMQYVGEEFNITVAGTNQSQISGVTTSQINFENTICSFDGGFRSIEQKIINDTTIYSKSISTTCKKANYSAPETLSSVKVKLNTIEEEFFVGYDLSMSFASCNDFTTNYGTLKSCILKSLDGRYNNDYWENDYGLIKVKIGDFGENKVSNDYGELIVYIE